MEDFYRLSSAYQNHSLTSQQLRRTEYLLDDATLLACAYYIAHGKGKTLKEVRIIPPTVIHVLINPGTFIGKNDNPEQYKELFLRDVDLIIIPINFQKHWSLLYYRRESNLWVSMDSLSPSHAHHVESLLKTLSQKGFLPEGMSAGNVHSFTNLVRQPGGWQCGTYTILFIQMVLTANSEAEIQESLFRLCEKTRMMLIETLVVYLNEK